MFRYSDNGDNVDDDDDVIEMMWMRVTTVMLMVVTLTMLLYTDEQVVCCRLSSLQSSLYKSLINSKSTLSALSKVGSGKVTASSLSSIMHLKKLCNRKLLFTIELITMYMHYTYDTHLQSGKVL